MIKFSGEKEEIQLYLDIFNETQVLLIQKRETQKSFLCNNKSC